mmetsp:Transcript_106711/g.188966  ORF Transcript_106711/g.188966 Transcript_106711/m.188966 type:complete len:249 (+) Transcript_106711:100-846(+)
MALGAAAKVKRHRCIGRLPPEIRSLVLTAHDDTTVERLRERVLAYRDRAIVGCVLEMAISMAAMALYDLRRSILVPIMNSLLTGLSAIGLGGALHLRLRSVQVHGILTTGLIIALVLNFFAEALLSSTGLGATNLPGWMVLVVLLVPYSLNLACSVQNLLLGGALSDFLEKDELNCGLLGNAQLERQAVELSGQDLCCVCMVAKKDAVLTPCGHKVLCESCGEQLRSRRRTCPICRSHINGCVRVFES